MTSDNMPQTAVPAYRTLPLLASAVALMLAAGCSDDPTEPVASAGRDGMAGAASEPGTAGGGGEGSDGVTMPPVYAVSTTVFDDTNAATYVALIDSLDNRAPSNRCQRSLPFVLTGCAPTLTSAKTGSRSTSHALGKCRPE